MRDLLGATENGTQTFSAILLELNGGFVTQSEFAADLRSTRIVAEKDDFNVRVQQRPTL